MFGIKGHFGTRINKSKNEKFVQSSVKVDVLTKGFRSVYQRREGEMRKESVLKSQDPKGYPGLLT